MENTTKYALFQKEEKYRDNTLLSLYFKKYKNNEKTCGPVDIDGYRYKVDFETGAIRTYTRSECEKNSYNSIERTKRLLRMLLLMNDFDWFCTLTFDNKRINRQSEKDVYHAYVKFIHNIKQQFPTLRYVTVIELHKSGEIHFHMVIGGVPWQKLGLENSGKVCCHWARYKDKICSREYFEKTKGEHTLKDTDGAAVYNITSFVYGFTTATRIVSREKCNTYISKYITKDLGTTDIFKKRFYYSSNLRVPTIVKRCVGADFNNPENVSLLAQGIDAFKYSDSSSYLDDYNIFMATISNDKFTNIQRGLIPCSEDLPFSESVLQEKFV